MSGCGDVRAALESQLDSVAFSQRHRRFAGRGRDNLGIARRRHNINFPRPDSCRCSVKA
jgi:hypothetical protein